MLVPVFPEADIMTQLKVQEFHLGKHTLKENWKGSGSVWRAIRPCSNLMPGEGKT